MRKKSILVLLCFVLFISACGKKEENISSDDSSRDELGYVQTGEGLLYRYQVPGLYTRLEYYDYGSNTYMPLCVRANCTHDTEECAAVRLGNTSTIGRLGGKWYYLKQQEGFTYCFYSCDLDGQNEQKLGEIGHTGGRIYLYFDNSCVYTTNEPVFNEETGQWDYERFTGGLYQYHFDTKKEEALQPVLENGSYELCGEYENRLLFYCREKEGADLILKMLDMETGEVTEPLGKTDLYIGCVLSGNLFAYAVKENNAYSVKVLDLDTGKTETALEGLEAFPSLYWGTEIRLLTVTDEDDNRKMTYQYLGSGEYELVRTEPADPYYGIAEIKNGQVLADYMIETDPAESRLAHMSLEDFLAGKTNWTILEY